LVSVFPGKHLNRKFWICCELSRLSINQIR
jgi:predicted DNA-binding protein (MmcQ/YjbR family)